MDYKNIVDEIARILVELDHEKLVHKNFQPGIGPFGEPQLIKLVAKRLCNKGLLSETKRSPDLLINKKLGIEFKIVRPFGDNGKEAENWSVNMLHPYIGNTSLIGDAIKLRTNPDIPEKGLFIIGYEHNPPKISLNPLIDSFEIIAKQVMNIHLSERIDIMKYGLIHPEHQVLRCIAWLVI